MQQRATFYARSVLRLIRRGAVSGVIEDALFEHASGSLWRQFHNSVGGYDRG